MSRIRPARVLAATTVVALTAGIALAAPAEAATKSTSLRTAAGASVAGAPSKLYATVVPTPSGGTVTFSVSGRALTGCAKVALTSGHGSCTTTFTKVGTRTVTATYSGVSTKFASSKKSWSVTSTQYKAGSIVGSTGACTLSKGALVAVGFGKWSGPVVRGCDTTPTKGNELLDTAGFTHTGTQHDGPQFICRLGHNLFNSGTQYPTAAEDKCVNTPPASAYWSYWLAAKGSNTWTYATLGAYSQTATDGQVQAWTFGSTDVDGTTGQPSFTPNQVRAGMTASASKTAGRKSANTSGRVASSKAKKASDLESASGYLVKNLVDGSHFEPFGGPDYGLTIDGALALAASGADDAALAKITAFVRKNQNDYTFLSGEYADYVGGGYVGKVALLAEVTGQDPSDFGGVDLIDALDGLTCTQDDVQEGLEGCTVAGNYRGNGSVFGQSLGIIAQLRADDAEGAARAVKFLEGLQIGSGDDAGAFPSLIPSSGSGAEVDSTAMAAMALALVDTDAARGAVSRALAWIADQQNADGGFPGAAGNSSNSAALAALGLGLDASEYGDEIAAARDFLAGLQNSDGGFDVSDDTDGSDVRATTQVVSALAGPSFGTLERAVDLPADGGASDPDAPDADAGADYLVDNLVDGTEVDFPGGGGTDYGATADVAFALAAAGGHDTTLVKLVRFLRDHVADYADPKGSGEYPGPYGGSLAKLALLAEATGQDPADFGGFDLLKTLTDTLCTERGAGDFPTCGAAGEFYQIYATVSQALGVLALARDGDDVPQPAVTRLLQLQCADGGFSSELIQPGADCTSEVDTTGFALQALVLVDTPDADEAVSKAVAFLRGAQNDDGSYTGAAGKSSNSTALAIQGLLAAPETATTAKRVRALVRANDPSVSAALKFLASLQNGDGGFGISTTSTGSDLRATTQSTVAAALRTYTTLRHPVSLSTAPGDGGSDGGDGSTTPVAGSGPDGDGATADTGVPAGQLIQYAILLLVLGAALAAAGRRRNVVLIGRHRGDA